MTDLPSLTGSGGSAAAINDRGQIAGTSPVPGAPEGTEHAVVWR
jgi:hypothetical protein